MKKKMKIKIFEKNNLKKIIFKKIIFTQQKRKWPKSAKQEFSLKKGLGSTYTP